MSSASCFPPAEAEIIALNKFEGAFVSLCDWAEQHHMDSVLDRGKWAPAAEIPVGPSKPFEAREETQSSASCMCDHYQHALSVSAPLSQNKLNASPQALSISVPN